MRDTEPKTYLGSSSTQRREATARRRESRADRENGGPRTQGKGGKEFRGGTRKGKKRAEGQ